jgi:hypothetical protein
MLSLRDQARGRTAPAGIDRWRCGDVAGNAHYGGNVQGRAADRDCEFDCKAAWRSADFLGPGQRGDRKADDSEVANSNIDGLCGAQYLWCSIKVHVSATDPDTDRILERAVQWGIETQHYDGLGRHRLVAPQVLARILDVMARAGAPPPQSPDVSRAPIAAPDARPPGPAARPRRAFAAQLGPWRLHRLAGLSIFAAVGAAGVGPTAARAVR